MCYFAHSRRVSSKVIPRDKAIIAWKAFRPCSNGMLLSPICYNKWKIGVAKKATIHGFYAIKTRREARDYMGGRVMKVKVWGRVREYSAGAYDRNGYRAQYCMILPR